MGGSTCSFPQIMSKDFQVPNLKQKNDYGQGQSIPQSSIIENIFAVSYNENRNSRIVTMIKQNGETFVDSNFIVDSKQKTRLSILFDFKRMNTRIYFKKGDYDLTNFVQLNIEFSYLSVVFYLLCRKQIRKSFIQTIIENQETNDYGAYVLNFFCNGEKHQIIIDDEMPTISDSFMYTRIVKGVQLWPLLVEKAWCKQIGSYERAKGLSPEDSFEEIIGAPAYTYKFRIDNRQFMKRTLEQAIKLKYWVALVARNGLQDLKNRQVFYLQQIDDQQNCLIISPYSSYEFLRYKHQRRGEVKVKQEDLYTHFEYAVIGFYIQGYQNVSIPVVCKSHEELIFQINIKQTQQVSIRFNQFYEGYLKQQERYNYKYSPILIELYEIKQKDDIKEYSLILQCQGCNRSRSGARSIHCSKEIFKNMQGKYLIRIEVNWEHEELINKGNLVVYATKGNADIIELKNNAKVLTEVYQSIFEKFRQKQNITVLNEQNIEITTFNKINSTLFMIKNLINSPQMFTIQFKNSTNIKIRGGEVTKNKTNINLQAKKTFILQVFPLDIRCGMSLQGLDITRNEQKH